MIFHASIEADDPERVAAALARLWQGEAFPFPPVGEGSQIVLAGDHRGSAVEVYARGTRLFPTEGEPAVRLQDHPERRSAVHLAMATPLSAEEVESLANEEGWLVQRRSRGGLFEVMEVWIENGFLIEALTPPMQAQYLSAITPAKWRELLASGPPVPA